MLRQAGRVCPFCEVRSLFGGQRIARSSIHVQPPLIQSRLYTQVQQQGRDRDRGRDREPEREREQSRDRGRGAPRDRNTDRDRHREPGGGRPRGGGDGDAGAYARPRPRSPHQAGRPSRGRDQPRPSRMVLSDTVDRPSFSNAKAPRRPDAFDYLNKTQVPKGLERHRERREGQAGQRATGRDGDKRRSKTPQQPLFHALKMQSSLHQVPYNNRTAVKRKLEEYDSFDKFPLLEPIQRAVNDALPGLEYRHPTPAQAVAIPALLGLSKTPRTKIQRKSPGPESFLLAAETGSGKTLAYLLPTLDAIKKQELDEKDQAEEEARQDAEKAASKPQVEKRTDIFAVEEPSLNKAVDPARPRAIILVPSAELVNQVGATAKSLSHVVKFRAAPISAQMSATVIRNQLFNPSGVDLVISTPPLLASIVSSNPNILARVTHLICDEADSLFDRSFRGHVEELINRASPSMKQLVLCSATIPKYLDNVLAKEYPEMTRLVTPNLHAVPRRVQLGVVDVNKDPYHGDKYLACADTIWQIGKASNVYDADGAKESASGAEKRILVFVNEREDTEKVASYLKKKGIEALAFHRDTDPVRAAKALSVFSDPKSAPPPPSLTDEDTGGVSSVKDDEKKENGSGSGSSISKEKRDTTTTNTSSRTLPNTRVLVTTDLGSRGVDTIAVRHVILFDVPHTTIDFIHRLGRTGRMGRRGRGIVLLGRGDRADVVREVREAMFRGEALI